MERATALLAECCGALAEELPLLAERRRIAALIRTQIKDCPDHPMPLPKPSCWQCGRNGAFHRAALIALGEFSVPREASSR